jgi:hypothetical protein
MPLLNDNITETLEGVGELIRELPPEARERAKYAAMAFEQLFQKLRVAHPSDPAIALGAAWAIFTLADRLVKLDNEGEQQGSGLVKLITL